jgi:subtilisin family serine protease
MKKFGLVIILLLSQNTKIFCQERNSTQDFYLRVNNNYYKNVIEVTTAIEHSINLSNATLEYINKPFQSKAIGDFSAFYRISFKVKNKEQLVSELFKIAGFERIEKVIQYQFFHFPNDPKFTVSADTMWHLYKIKAQAAWNLSRGSDSVVIAVIDDNFEITHPDLQPNIFINPLEIPNDNIDNDINGIIDDVNGADLSNNTGNPFINDPNFIHGTRTSGCASASTNNGIGIASIGYSCKILPVKCTDNFNYVSHGLEAMFYAASMPQVQVVNMSWGFETFSQTMQDIIDSAMSYKDNKIVFVAAAGNTSDSLYIYPAACNNVIAVGATDKFDSRTSFSKFGSWVDIAAPGRAIYTTTLNSKYGGNSSGFQISGTSYSSPLVAGTVGLMYAINKDLTFNEVLQCLEDGGDSINSDFMIGKRLNAYKSIQCICSTNTCTLGEIEIETKPNHPKIIYNNQELKIENLINDNFDLNIYDVLGRVIFHKPLITSEIIRLEYYNKGVYIVRISDKNEIETKKIIVE